ncbi:hypothetical protein BC828DRAFT_123231 [Blastocladiella britannica]|nr:hypothetical protein BC828DRAFT_123231 [Blastocladiella britannica]
MPAIDGTTRNYTLGANFDGAKAMAVCPQGYFISEIDFQSNSNADAASGRPDTTAYWASGVHIVCSDAQSTTVDLNWDSSRNTTKGPARPNGIKDMFGYAGLVVTYLGYGQTSVGPGAGGGTVWSQANSTYKACMLSGMTAYTGQNAHWLHSIDFQFLCPKPVTTTSSSASATSSPTATNTPAPVVEEKSGLSGGAIVGIGAGILAAAVVAFVLLGRVRAASRKDLDDDDNGGSRFAQVPPPPPPPAPQQQQQQPFVPPYVPPPSPAAVPMATAPGPRLSYMAAPAPGPIPMPQPSFVGGGGSPMPMPQPLQQQQPMMYADGGRPMSQGVSQGMAPPFSPSDPNKPFQPFAMPAPKPVVADAEEPLILP